MFAPDVKPNYWYEADIQMLARATAIFLVEGWQESKGAVAERAFCMQHGIPVYYAETESAPTEWGEPDFLTLCDNWGKQPRNGPFVIDRGV